MFDTPDLMLHFHDFWPFQVIGQPQNDLYGQNRISILQGFLFTHKQTNICHSFLSLTVLLEIKQFLILSNGVHFIGK